MTVTLEKATMLKAAGWHKPTRFCWIMPKESPAFVGSVTWLGKEQDGAAVVFAPTPQEIIEALPDGAKVMKFNGGFEARLDGPDESITYYEDTMADALACLWIGLQKA